MNKYGGALFGYLTSLCQPHYREPLRRYHTWGHVVGIMGQLPDATKAQTLAAVFHDIVYVPGFKGNEEASAELMWSYFSKFPDRFPGVCLADLELADEMILATRDHKYSRTEEIGKFLDADLSGLASADYWKNRDLIREEFVRYPDPAFKEGRARFLEGMLDRPYIFHTRKDLERPARDNIEQELRGR